MSSVPGLVIRAHGFLGAIDNKVWGKELKGCKEEDELRLQVTQKCKKLKDAKMV